MSVNTNQTNANKNSSYYALASSGPSNNFYELSFDAAQNSGAVWPNPNGDPNDYTLLTYANYGLDPNVTGILTAAGPTVAKPIAAGSLIVGEYGGAPFCVIENNNDGIILSGRDNNGVRTQDWLTTGKGVTQIAAVSTMTDSNKTATLNFTAFLSTMKSVYPEIVAPYS